MIQRPGELGNGQFLLITLVSILIIPDLTESESYYCFIILFYYYSFFKHGAQFDIVLGNHLLRAQPIDESVFC